MTPIASGLVLDERYALTERIAVGGMGEVWRATDRKLSRPVAVKLLKPEYADDATFRERFRAEGRHAAMLSHSGIASVFDYGEFDGVCYLVMELVDGEPLSHLLAREGRLSVARSLDIVGQTALALQAAHDVGVIHRDVKPGNLLIRADGVVKVTDFGIARAADAAPITQAGLVLGTAHYLSPEQSHGNEVTFASDVYSLGVVAYECLAGRRPFTGDNLFSIVRSHAADPAPPLPDDVPAPVALLVMQALEKDPVRRPESAGAFGRTALALLGAIRTTHTAAPEPIAVQPPPAATLGETRAFTGATPSAAAATAERSGVADPRRTRLAFAGIVVVAILVAAWVLHACTPTSAKQGAAASTTAPMHSATPRTFLVRASDYVGKPYADARAALLAHGLAVDRRDVASGVAAGSVATVAPTGEVRLGATVVLGVSTGPATPAGQGVQTGQGTQGKHAPHGKHGKHEGKDKGGNG